MNKVVFITGATSGIGRACAYRFASEKYDIILSGRRVERLTALAAELEDKFGIAAFSLPLDVRQQADVASAITKLPEHFSRPDILINNAGLALGLSPLHEGDPAHWDTMIDTNIKGVLYMSKALLPGMIERKRGHIINIGSIAGREAYANGNVYCATKAAIDSLTKSMRMELLPFGIKVTQIAPGAVETEFSEVRFSGDTDRAKSVYKGFEPLREEDIANVVYFAASLPPHVNINDLLIMPTAQASGSMIHRESEK
ncbi:NADP-dependent 3-hydroxy acid dehydrogenase YdfG [anaerobic digester metagenome]|nr:SDR family oxidoreductase [Lentimicrobiaceae bacterium]